MLLYLYCALAAFSVSVILSNLYLNHRLMDIYNESVRVNQEWDERLSRYRTLGQLAAAVNAPGADIYASNDVAGETERLRAALRAFNEAIPAAREDLRGELSRASRREGAFLERLKAAVETDATEEIERIVHTAAGGSGTLGMVALLRLLQELGRMSDENRLHDAARVAERIGGELERVESYFNSPIASESTA